MQRLNNRLFPVFGRLDGVAFLTAAIGDGTVVKLNDLRIAHRKLNEVTRGDSNMATPPHRTTTRTNVTPRHFTSLREFLDALRDLGDLREVNYEVDTDLEIGAIIRRVHETNGPAPLFTNIRGTVAIAC
jgi:hypothetical protein